MRLAVCRFCALDFVVLIDGGAIDDEHWIVELRCGSCEGRTLVVASHAALDAYCEELEWRTVGILADADQLWRERTAAAIDTFVTALDRDLIGGDDFAR